MSTLNSEHKTTFAEIMAAKVKPGYDGDVDELARKQLLIRMTGLPIRHVMALDEIQPAGEWATTLEQLREYVAAKQIVALLGPRGTGKTQLVTRVVLDQLNNPPPGMAQVWCPRYFKAFMLFQALREAMKSERGEAAFLRQLAAVRLLVIDEAHERAETEYENRVLVALIDQRYDAMLPTILISNQTREAFAQSIGASIVSRMHECGEVVECKWGSFRE